MRHNQQLQQRILRHSQQHKQHIQQLLQHRQPAQNKLKALELPVQDRLLPRAFCEDLFR
jgi:hypothetical protein